MLTSRGSAAGGASPSPRAAPPASCGRGSARRRGGRARAGRRARRAPRARAGAAPRRRPAPRASADTCRSTGTSTPWSERQPSSSVSRSSLGSTIRGLTAATGSSSSPSRKTNTRRSDAHLVRGEPDAVRVLHQRLHPLDEPAEVVVEVLDLLRAQLSTGSGHWRICASAIRRRASRSASSCSSSTWPWSSALSVLVIVPGGSVRLRRSADRRRRRR